MRTVALVGAASSAKVLRRSQSASDSAAQTQDARASAGSEAGWADRRPSASPIAAAQTQRRRALRCGKIRCIVCQTDTELQGQTLEQCRKRPGWAARNLAFPARILAWPGQFHRPAWF